MIEIWRPVVGYEGIYSVSSLGRVRRDLPYNGSMPKKILRPGLTSGYLVVSLWAKNKGRMFSVHTLVLNAFHGPRKSRQQSRHLNGCRTDNRQINLEWGSAKENWGDKILHGTATIGEKNSGTRMNTFLVRAMVALRLQGVKQKTLSQMFGIARTTVSGICNGYKWGHVSKSSEFR